MDTNGTTDRRDTHRQEVMRKFLDYIVRFTNKYGYSPTVREIQVGLRVSSSSVVNFWLGKMEHTGLIQRSAGKARNIRVIMHDQASDIQVNITLPHSDVGYLLTKAAMASPGNSTDARLEKIIYRVRGQLPVLS